MTSYRVVRRKCADLKGYGAWLYGGRFNSPGTPAVYSSQSIALALLEVLVHLGRAEVPADYVVMAIRFDGNGASRPRASGVAQASNFKAAFHGRPILRVSSVIVAREYNYVLYPEAVGFQAAIDWIEPLDFDSRLVASAGR